MSEPQFSEGRSHKAPGTLIVCDDARRLESGTVPGQDLLERRKGAHRCSFADLRDPARAECARQYASDAEVILFAMGSSGDLPAEVKSWIESWLHRRTRREGTLVGLVMGSALHGSPTIPELYLRHTARRAGMDYLSHLPTWFGRGIPDSLDSYGKRADKVTSVLNQILEKRNVSVPPR